jgi:hypothetical protein
MKNIRNILALGLMLIATYAVGYAVYNATLVNEPALAYSNTYVLDLNHVNPSGFSQFTAQAVYSSATMATNSFTDGHASTGSVTVINTTNLAARAATNQITVAATNVILAASATNYLLVLTTQSLTNAVVTYNGNPLRQGTEWTVVATTTGTAANIRTAIARFNGVTATRTNSQVDLTVTPAGVSGNSKTLAVNTSSITIGGASFGGGHNNRLMNAYLTVNGRAYYQGGAWKMGTTSSGTATNIATFLGHLNGINASASGSVVYSTASVANAAGNLFTLTSSQPSYLTVAGATYSGGFDNAKVCIKGTCVTQGTDWTQGATVALTAKAISDAIIAKAALSSVLSSTWNASGVVSATSTVTGTAAAFAFTTNVPSYFLLSSVAFEGATSSAWTTGTSVISIPSHGLSTGYGVVFSTGSGVTVAPLVWGTTYYVARLASGSIALSTTSAQAVAGSYIVLPAPSAAGGHSFTLTPTALSGTASFKWQGSNDSVSWTDLAVSSVTFGSPYTADLTSWDFGHYNYRYARLNFVKPTQGGVNLVVTLNGTN